MSIADFRELGESPDGPSSSPKGNILQAFPPTELDIRFRNGYIFRLDPCGVVTGYDPDYCEEPAQKMSPSFYGPEVTVPVRMVQAAFSCSTVGASDEELRYWAKNPIQLKLWTQVDTVLTALLAAQATDETPFPIPAKNVLSEAAQYLATHSSSGTGVIYGPMSWLSELGTTNLTWNGNHYEDLAGNIIIPSSVDSNVVYAFDSFVDIKISSIQVLDELFPAVRENNTRTVRAEQLYTVAASPCVVGAFEVGVTAIGDSVVVEPGSFPLNVQIVAPIPLPVSFIRLNCATDSVTICSDDPIEVTGTVSLSPATLAALETITVNQGTSPWVIGDGGGSITVDGTVTADTNFDYPEDSPHVSGNPGAFVLAVRNDAGTPLAADGDYIPFTTDATGALRVNATFSGDVTVSLDCATDSVTICPGVDPIVVSGTVELGATTLAALETITVNQGTSPWVVSGTVAATQSGVWTTGRTWDLNFATDQVDASGSVVALDAGTLAALETITVLQGTSPWVVSGTVAVTQSTSPWVTSLDAPTLSALESITVQNGAGAAAVNIQDGGNSITVDGTVTVNQGTSPWVVSGTVTADTNFDYAEDTLHVTGDVGAFVLAVRNDAGTPLAGNGDYIPFTTDATGALRVTGGSNQFEYPEDSPHVSGAVGAFTLAVRNDAGTPLAADGDYIPFTTDNTGKLRVTGGDSAASAAGLAVVPDVAVTTTLSAANTARTGWFVFNDSTEPLFVKYGAGATRTDCNVLVPCGALYEMPKPIYQGIITGIWSNDSIGGVARVTELT